MSPKSIKIALFVVLAIAQIYFPVSMIWQQEETINNGQAFRFETAPVDPNDPFRGKYITLRFTAEEFYSDQSSTLPNAGKVFVLLGEDEEGFAKVESVQVERPTEGQHYISAEIWGNYEEDNWVRLKFPFERYYMEESKAYEAELAHRRSRRDSTQKTYALVMVQEGNSALEDVVLDGVSIKEVVEQGVKD
ncbi:MAG: GDYXXLXY domain-containing protein [Bacteroidia bacterium]